MAPNITRQRDVSSIKGCRWLPLVASGPQGNRRSSPWLAKAAEQFGGNYKEPVLCFGHLLKAQSTPVDKRHLFSACAFGLRKTHLAGFQSEPNQFEVETIFNQTNSQGHRCPKRNMFTPQPGLAQNDKIKGGNKCLQPNTGTMHTLLPFLQHQEAKTDPARVQRNRL